MSAPAYQPVPNTDAVPNGVPPGYGEESPVEVNEASTSAAGDNIPDDFKFGTSVYDCDVSIRRLFIRKVYSLLAVQLLATFAIGFVLNYNDTTRAFAFQNIWIFWLTVVCSFVFLFLTQIFRRSYPKNVVFLTGFTCCMGYMSGLSATAYDTPLVINALVLTSAIFISLTLFAFQTKYDFTDWAGMAFFALSGMCVFGLFSLFLPYNSVVDYIYSIAGASLFSIYILIDTQMIMKTLHPEDEVIGAVQLYLDIVNLFLYILRILAHQNNDD